MDDHDKFCCVNKNCPKHGVRGEKNIRVRDVYGPNKTRLLDCLICKQCFSERRGTVLFDSRLPEETAIAILEHVAEGVGMRKTGRLLKVDHETVIGHKGTFANRKNVLNCCQSLAVVVRRFLNVLSQKRVLTPATIHPSHMKGQFHEEVFNETISQVRVVDCFQFSFHCLL